MGQPIEAIESDQLEEGTFVVEERWPADMCPNYAAQAHEYLCRKIGDIIVANVPDDQPVVIRIRHYLKDDGGGIHYQVREKVLRMEVRFQAVRYMDVMMTRSPKEMHRYELYKTAFQEVRYRLKQSIKNMFSH